MAQSKLNMKKSINSGYTHAQKLTRHKPHLSDGYSLFHPPVADTQDHPGVY